MIIVFSGIDGAGKSTQIERLTQYLERDGKCVSVIWSRGGYTPGIEWLKNAVRKILKDKVPASGSSPERTKSLSSNWIGYVWLSLAMLDLLVLYGVVIRWRSLMGRVVICDRYLRDTELDFHHNFSKIKFQKMLLWKLLVLSSPKADASFVLWISVDESLRRSSLKNEPFPDNSSTLEWRLKEYLDTKRFPDSKYVRICCEQPLESIEAQVMKEIERIAK